jgi:flagellar L-ring protein precursor FlgH
MNARSLSSPLILLCLLAFGGCDTFDHFQKPPNFSSPGKVNEIPATAANEPVIKAANMPPLDPATRGSLWRPGSKAFFRDPRARNVGDLLTIAVHLQEQAEFANQTALTRTTANSMSLTNLFGIGTLIGRLIPGVANTDPSINTAGSDSTQGQGDIKRSENITVNVAATVVRVLPNNNLEVAGSQEIRLNNELREMQIRGIVRPEDIGSDNTISSARIAEARIAYGGRGVSSDLQRPTWGQDIINRAAPF